MPNLLLDLEVDRVDLVNEGANSEAFIKLYKRKEREKDMTFEEILAKMKPEHKEVVEQELEKAKTEVPAEVKEELEKAQELLDKSKPEPSEEEVLKSLDPKVQEIVKSLKAQKEAAEETAKELMKKKEEEDAISKAKSFKNLPVEEEKLVSLLKTASDEVIEVLKAANDALENSASFEEIGKGNTDTVGVDAYAKIEKRAQESAKAEGITVEKAFSTAVKEMPEQYKEYLDGGAN